MRKTKILAKIADNRSEVAFIKSLVDAGANVAWLNTAHQDEAATLKVIENIRAVSTSIPIAIDTKGPEVRTRNIEAPFEVKKGDHVIFTGSESYKGANVIPVTYPNFHNEVPVGEVILYDDALIEFKVVEKPSKAIPGIKCVVNNAGLIKNKKSINVPNVHIHLPALSEKDKGFINFCARHNIDFITHSFVRNREDIAEIRKITDAYPDYKPKIIAKIENREGFKNVRDILKHCDGLMVARGDLGAEVGLENVPFMQMDMVDATLEQGKYCIVATQALESMIKNPRPTRAEVSDVANAVLEGTGAMSMSGETAYGDFPVEATTMMGKVMRATEEHAKSMFNHPGPKVSTKEHRLAKGVVQKARKNIAGIVTIGVDISLNRALATHHPTVSVFAGCTSDVDTRELCMAFAIQPVHMVKPSFEAIVKGFKNELKAGGRVIVIEPNKKSYKITTKKI